MRVCVLICVRVHATCADAARKTLGDANAADLEMMQRAAQAIKRVTDAEPTTRPTVEEVNVTIDMP
eukprot:8669871-Pyramimonas_sp.AAC.1